MKVAWISRVRWLLSKLQVVLVWSLDICVCIHNYIAYTRRWLLNCGSLKVVISADMVVPRLIHICK
jgi:hypothetical protein